jgi:hypothetical protein
MWRPFSSSHSASRKRFMDSQSTALGQNSVIASSNREPGAQQLREVQSGVCRLNHSLELSLVNSDAKNLVYCDECGRSCGLSPTLVERMKQCSRQSDERLQVSLRCNQCNYDVCLSCASCLGFWVQCQNARCMKGHALATTLNASDLTLNGQLGVNSPVLSLGGACFMCNDAKDLRWSCCGSSALSSNSASIALRTKCDFFLCASCSTEMRVGAPADKAPLRQTEEHGWSQSLNPTDFRNRSVPEGGLSSHASQPPPQAVALRCPRGHWLMECPVFDSSSSKPFVPSREDRMCDDCGLVIPLKFVDSSLSRATSQVPTVVNPFQLPLPTYFYQCWPCDFDLCEKCASNRLQANDSRLHPVVWNGTEMASPGTRSLQYEDRNFQPSQPAHPSGSLVHSLYPPLSAPAPTLPPTFILNWNGVGFSGSSPYPASTGWPPSTTQQPPQMIQPQPNTPPQQPTGYFPQYI